MSKKNRLNPKRDQRLQRKKTRRTNRNSKKVRSRSSNSLALAKAFRSIVPNVSLLAENCDYERQGDGLVWCWPKERRSTDKPLQLRLVHVQIGTASVYLLTSVLSRRQLNVNQMKSFYKMRWGIEIEFRGLKQTLDRAKLSYRTSERQRRRPKKARHQPGRPGKTVLKTPRVAIMSEKEAKALDAANRKLAA